MHRSMRRRKKASRSLRVAVIGAGAFGGWTALSLVRRGARVTLLDAWGPGNVRASSGGETRVIRAGYGSRAIYTRMAARALARWRGHDAQFGRGFYRKTGALWMCGKDDRFPRATAAALAAEGVALDELSLAVARRRYPQINFAGVRSILFEPDAGFLLARRACEHIVERVVAEGGEYLQSAVVSPVRVPHTRLDRLALTRGHSVVADVFVFACGPWLGRLFPGVVGRRVSPTRQDVFYFGTPAGDRRFMEDQLPVWVDLTARPMYGIPGNANRGFKIADDTSGPLFDPTNGDRNVGLSPGKAIRRYLARRFPAMARAPLVGAEVCQYEASPDSDYVIDRHPGTPNVWIVGGGSGHGFKMGPVIGELVAAHVMGQTEPDPLFSLSRFANARARMSAEKWA
jgi:glycine/D-amino acid oxidase-like deaminating enzyme